MIQRGLYESTSNYWMSSEYQMNHTVDNKSHKSISLTPCGNRPNCVSSLNFEGINFVEPISYTGSKEDAKKTLIKILGLINPRGTAISAGSYVHSEFVSSLFGFTDDVEFLIEDRHKRIQLKSASRIGFYDLGMNRRRIETIRRLFNAAREG